VLRNGTYLKLERKVGDYATVGVATHLTLDSAGRKEDDRFVQGAGRYLDDVVLPGMLHMAILRSPVANRPDRVHRHLGRAETARRGRGHHRRDAGRLLRPVWIWAPRRTTR
jgi:hypothetical protein